jgi:methyl-accepting chemotaxis protein
MSQNFIVLAVAGLIGTVILLGILRLIFKNSISFLVGLFIYLITLMTVILLETDILQNPMADRILGSILLVGLAVIMVYIFDKRIGAPLRQLTKHIDKLSEGDLSVQFDVQTKEKKNELGSISRSLDNMLSQQKESVNLAKRVASGELYINVEKHQRDGDLDKALKQMVQKLREISEHIKLATEQVETGSKQVSSAAQSISQGASEQAASSEEVASSMEQMATTNEHNAENAQKANQIAQSVTKEMEVVNQSVIESTEAMKNISEKITIINDIAEKTDLLAINAAIEAARAGEYGKGFAVVAGEIRELAENSQKAADVIENVSKESLSKIKESEKQLNNIVPGIKNTSTLIQEISASSKEQQSGIGEVNSALQQLSSVTQKNSSSAEEMATSAEELAAQSEKLMDTIAFFKTTEEEQNKFSEKEIEGQIERLKNLLKSRKESGKKEEKSSIKEKSGNKKRKTEDKENNSNSGVNLNMDDDFEKY